MGDTRFVFEEGAVKAPCPSIEQTPIQAPTNTHTHKQCLYADTFMTREEFREMFNHELYDKMRVKVRGWVGRFDLWLWLWLID